MKTSLIDLYTPYFTVSDKQPVKKLIVPKKYGDGHLLFFQTLSGFELIAMRSSFSKEYSFPFTWREEMIELVIPIKGMRCIQFSNHKISVEQNNTFFNYLQHFEGTSHFLQSDFQSLSINIPIAWYERWVTKEDVPQYRFTTMLQQQMLSRIERPITKPILQQAQYIMQLMCLTTIDELKIEIAVLQLLDLYFSKHFVIEEPIGYLTAEEKRKLALAKALLLQHMDSPPYITVLAQKVGLNEQKLKQGFKQVYGTSPYKYLKEERMQKAYDCLLHQRMSVTETALCVGYQNVSYFSQLFCHYFGTKPSQLLKE